VELQRASQAITEIVKDDVESGNIEENRSDTADDTAGETRHWTTNYQTEFHISVP